MPPKKVKVHYRKLYRHAQTPFSDSLSALIHQSLNTNFEGVPLSHAVSARAFTDQDGNIIVLNGLFSPQPAVVFAELVRYDPGTNIPLLVQNQESASELEIRTIGKPNDAEILRGLNFFMIRDDHVLAIECDLAIGAIERYLRWLAATQAKVVKDSRLILAPKILLEDERAALKRVRTISLDPPAQSASLFRTAAANEVENEELFLGDRNKVLDVLSAAHFDTGVLNRLMADENLSVKIKLSVSFKAGRKQTTVEGEDALALLRNVDEEDLIIEGDHARKKRGVVERLTVTDYVERNENIVQRKDAWRALEDAYTHYRKVGIIV